MKKLQYNRINGPTKTVSDYLQTLTTDDLNDIYSNPFFSELKLPDLLKKVKTEFQTRQLNTQLNLF
jgi:hypothetical protein